MPKNSILILVLILMSGIGGYFYRAYTEKPKVIEVPKLRTQTRTVYKDGKIVEVIKDSTKFDTDAALKLRDKRNLVQLHYGLVDKTEVYGLGFSRSVFPNIYIGATVLVTKTGVEGGLVGLSWTF